MLVEGHGVEGKREAHLDTEGRRREEEIVQGPGKRRNQKKSPLIGSLDSFVEARVLSGGGKTHSQGHTAILVVLVPVSQLVCPHRGREGFRSSFVVVQPIREQPSNSGIPLAEVLGHPLVALDQLAPSSMSAVIMRISRVHGSLIRPPLSDRSLSPANQHRRPPSTPLRCFECPNGASTQRCASVLELGEEGL